MAGIVSTCFTSDADVDQQLLHELAGGESVPDVPLPAVHLCGVCPDDLVGK